jgi:hypothetical protein
MPVKITLDVIALILLLVTAASVALITRRRLLERLYGTFDCSLRLRRRADVGEGWSFGLARYRGDNFEWFPVFGFSGRPRHVFVRRDLRVLQRRPPGGSEAYAIVADSLIMECSFAGRSLDIAMTRDAATGFLSWLEAAPPGQHVVA